MNDPNSLAAIISVAVVIVIGMACGDQRESTTPGPESPPPAISTHPPTGVNQGSER